MATSAPLPRQVRFMRRAGLALIVAGVLVSFAGALLLSIPAMDWAGRAAAWTGVLVLVVGALRERRLRVQGPVI